MTELQRQALKNGNTPHWSETRDAAVAGRISGQVQAVAGLEGPSDTDAHGAPIGLEHLPSPESIAAHNGTEGELLSEHDTPDLGVRLEGSITAQRIRAVLSRILADDVAKATADQIVREVLWNGGPS